MLGLDVLGSTPGCVIISACVHNEDFRKQTWKGIKVLLRQKYCLLQHFRKSYLPCVCVPTKLNVKSETSTTKFFDPKMPENYFVVYVRYSTLRIMLHCNTFLNANVVLFAMRLYITRYDQCENLESPIALKINANDADTNPGKSRLVGPLKH